MSETGIRVNMSAAEGKSVTSDPLPTGRYLMAITDCELEKVKNPPAPGKKDNRGEPMLKVELTVQDGDYEGRHAWTNVMLFKGALYSLAQMIKALGFEIKELPDGSAEFQIPGFDLNEVPGPEWWMSQQFVVKLRLTGKKIVKVGSETKEYDPRAEVKGFMSAKSWDPNWAPKKPMVPEGASRVVSSMLP